MVGVVAGIAIGIVAALMGVADSELPIPTIVSTYALDIKVAGSLSLAVSLPTMRVAVARYSHDQSFQVLAASKAFLTAMALGSIGGTVAGGLLLNLVLNNVLIPLLAALLLGKRTSDYDRLQCPAQSPSCPARSNSCRNRPRRLRLGRATLSLNRQSPTPDFVCGGVGRW